MTAQILQFSRATRRTAVDRIKRTLVRLHTENPKAFLEALALARAEIEGTESK